MKVENKVCIVTGGSNGIGAALVEVLAERKAAVVIVADLDVAGGLETAKRVSNKYKDCKTEFMKCDCSDEGSIRRVVMATKLKHNRHVDLFVANAGIGGMMGGADTTNSELETMFKINTMQIVWAARHVLPDMIKAGEGGIIVTASAAGLLAQIGSISYSITKHAAVAAAEWLAITHASQGISVSCLCPQAVKTNMTAGLAGGGVAGVDGMLLPHPVAKETIDAFEAGQFLVTPHKTVHKYLKAKALHHDKWLSGMSKLHDRTSGGIHAPKL
eukprot:TRINITY_DN2044_c12_g1_i1.p1 TRINITY_DN2044_c12_g1~~TRINITY_DN2044_c12_g1_i1.p1  ORF type:complete len:272 (+),score=69.36 TRINITY_DN2044_c12_g1_i1:196-1011(+)